MNDPRVEFKTTISVNGKQSINDLVQILANTRKTGQLYIVISEGGAVAATFEEKMPLADSS